jgi:hypothetical protein
MYLEALKDFPKTEIRLHTEIGSAVCQKVDIFKGMLWYAYEENSMNWHMLTTKRANEVIEINKKGGKASSLEDYAFEDENDITTIFNDVVGQDSLTRFDKPKRRKRRKRPQNNNRNKQNNRNRKRNA